MDGLSICRLLMLYQKKVEFSKESRAIENWEVYENNFLKQIHIICKWSKVGIFFAIYFIKIVIDLKTRKVLMTLLVLKIAHTMPAWISTALTINIWLWRFPCYWISCSMSKFRQCNIIKCLAGAGPCRHSVCNH